MPGMKKGKEIKLTTFKDYVISYGTVDNKNPKAIYIKISAWGEPLIDDDINYTRVISNLNKKVKQTLYNQIDEDLIFGDRSIVDLDMRESGIAYNKRSFMNCEITLFQTEPKPINDEEVKCMIEIIILHLIANVFNASKYFKFYKKKDKNLEPTTN